MPIKPKDQPHQKDPARHKRLGRLAILLAICGMIFFAIRYFVQPLPSMRFHATTNAQSVSFRLGSWPDSAGIFNSDTTRINLVLTSPIVLHFDTGSSIMCSAGSSLAGVRVVSMSADSQQNVSLDVQKDGLLHYALMPEFRTDSSDNSSSTKPKDLFVNILVDEKSNVRGVACEGAASGLKPGIWRMTPRSAGLPLEFSINFVPTLDHEKRDPASPPDGPDAEHEIPLADASSIKIQGTGGGANGSESQLQLLSSGQHVSLSEGLMLEGLRDTSIASLAYNAHSHLLAVDVAGVAAKIGIKSGNEQIQQTENRFGTLFPEKTAELMSALATLLCAAATLAAAVFGWTQHKERMEFDEYLHTKGLAANQAQQKEITTLETDPMQDKPSKSKET